MVFKYVAFTTTSLPHKINLNYLAFAPAKQTNHGEIRLIGPAPALRQHPSDFYFITIQLFTNPAMFIDVMTKKLTKWVHIIIAIIALVTVGGDTNQKTGHRYECKVGRVVGM